MRPGLRVLNGALYVLGAGQHGLAGGITAGVVTRSMPLAPIKA